MDSDIEKIKSLIGTNLTNAKVALQLLKGNKALAKSMANKAYIEELFSKRRSTEAEIGVILLKTDKNLKEFFQNRYSALIQFLGNKTVDSLKTAFIRTERIKRDWKIDLKLENWKEGVPFEEHLSKLPITKAEYSRQPLSRLPNFLTKFTHLSSIFISKCQLKELPDFWAKLSNLKKVEIINNHLEELPVSFTKLQKLEKLSLYCNRFKEVPSEIRAFKQLKNFYFSQNAITSLPDWIGELTNLERLSLYSTKLLTLPASLLKLEKLSFLSLSSTALGKKYNFSSSEKPEEIRDFIQRVLNDQKKLS